MKLILGCDGQLGTAFQNLFKEKNIEFLDIDKKELDITDLHATKSSILYVHKKRPIDCIINCAAYNDVLGAETNHEDCYKLNTLAVANLAEIAQNIGADFINFSTDYVFDGTEKDFIFNRKTGFFEKDETNPQTVYGKSKKEAEALLTNFIKNSKQKIYIIRTSWVFGSAKESSFLHKLLKWIRNQERLNVVDDEISSPSYSVDVVKLTYGLLENNAESGIYHITNDGIASRYEVAKYFLAKLKWIGSVNAISSDLLDSKVKRPAYSKLNCDKIKKTLNVEIPNWRDAINRYLDK